MQVKTFRAKSIQEALHKVREEFGPDANVLDTREVSTSRLGLLRKKVIEVEASSENTRPHGKSDAKVSRVEMLSGQYAGMNSDPIPSARGRASQSGQITVQAAEGGTISQNVSPSAAPSNASSEGLPAKTNSFASLNPRMPDEAYEIVTDLIEQGFTPEQAADLTRSAMLAIPTDQPADAWMLRGRIGQSLAKQFKTSGPIEVASDGDPKVVALVGPTGVGKTTTLAKIAAGFRFDLGLKVGMITVDTFRLGAVDQLLQYAELLSASLEVVSSPDQVSGAIQRQCECDIILIDTAGRSPRDSEQLSLLAQFIEAAKPDERHLVLSAPTSTKAAEAVLDRFAITRPTHLLLTKVDEDVSLGSWYELLSDASLPVSYMTMGQRVPEDVTVASGRRIASLMLGNSQFQMSQ